MSTQPNLSLHVNFPAAADEDDAGADDAALLEGAVVAGAVVGVEQPTTINASAATSTKPMATFAFIVLLLLGE
jgi:hypothetical protein